MSPQAGPDGAGGAQEPRSPQPAPAEPAEEVTRAIRAPGAEGERAERHPGPAKTILVVQDDLDTADSLRIRLESQGYNVVMVYDGLNALETARKTGPDVIILGITLPGLMGHHVCRLLKFDERYRKTPIIMLTSKVDEESREMAMKAGADRYVIKPFEMDELLEEIGWYTGAK